MASDSRTTIDAIFAGQLELEQPANGYRFNTDSVMLAGHMREKSLVGRVLDAGAGVGLLGLALALQHQGVLVDSVEIQPELAELCRRNAERNDLGDRVVCHCADVREYMRSTALKYDTIVVNPPYYAKGRGRLGPIKSKNVARHQLHGTIAEWMQALSTGMYSDSLLVTIYPARFLPTMLRAMFDAGFALHRQRAIHATPDKPASTVILEASTSNREREMIIDPPLIIQSNGVYTSEARLILNDGRHDT